MASVAASWISEGVRGVLVEGEGAGARCGKAAWKSASGSIGVADGCCGGAEEGVEGCEEDLLDLLSEDSEDHHQPIVLGCMCEIGRSFRRGRIRELEGASCEGRRWKACRRVQRVRV